MALYKRKFNPIYNMAGNMADGTDNAGGGGNNTVDDVAGDDGRVDNSPTESTKSQPDIEAAIAEATRGLKNKNSELLDSLAKYKAEARKFEGLDVEALKSLQKKVEQDEILKLHAEGKHTEAYDRMMEKERAIFESEKEKYIDELKAAQESAKTNKDLVETLLIDGGAQTEFAKANGLPEATPDILARARAVWKVEDGSTVARDNKTGELLRGEKGPLTMAEWIKGLKKDAPHLFVGSRGANALGGQGGQSGAADSIEAEMLAASESGDINKLRELRKRRYKG